jgi:Tfp pilus assembly protein PilF
VNRHQRRAESKRAQPAPACGARQRAAFLRQQGRTEEAVAWYRKAIALEPGDAELHNAIGIVLREQGRAAEAEASFRAAISLVPNHAGAHNNLGNALREQGQLDEAVACYRRSIALAPDRPATYSNLGATLQQACRLDEAIICYRQALDLAPDLAAAHHHLAMALLAKGDFAAGLPEFEWRMRTAQAAASQRNFAQKQWRGEAAPGQKLLIHAEQGFGDTLQFCRFAPLAAARGLSVTLEVQPALVRLLQASFPGMDVQPSGQVLEKFDVHCPMMSLPLAFGTTLETIPAGTYLRADPAREAAWRARWGKPVAMRRVGLCWAGNPRAHSATFAEVDRRRSIPPALLGPLFDVPGIVFVSLQKDGDLAAMPGMLLDFMPEMADFADTAALIANLDLVISVDTAVAHLAAGLGKPVWLLDRFSPCWRWLLGRHDSPWYPTLRIYRQSEPGDWTLVVKKVADDLRDLCIAQPCQPISSVA